MDLKEKINKVLLSKGTKLKNKYPPISQRRDGGVMVQKIKSIFQLRDDFKNFYLIITKSTNNRKERKFYLALILASQSSDLLAKIAKSIISNEKEMRLIQFSFHPEHFRVNLALLRELDELMDFDELKDKLDSLRTQFLSKLNNIID